MERKTKNRILGIIVMAALVVVLLPLFHGGKYGSKPDPQATEVPPFPDQSTQVSDNASPEFKLALATQTSPIPLKNSGEESVFNQLPDDTINPNTSRAYNNINKPTPAPESAHPAIKQPTVSHDDDIEAPIASNEGAIVPDTHDVFRNSLESELQAAAKPVAKKISHPTKAHETTKKIKQAKRKTTTPLPLDNNGLFKLKNPAWVIQLGSYKNKANALRLVNRLRANGYSAFIQQAAAGTSVYVGPESKQEIARSIATRLEYEMKIQGFVVSYKPLTL